MWKLLLRAAVEGLLLFGIDDPDQPDARLKIVADRSRL